MRGRGCWQFIIWGFVRPIGAMLTVLAAEWVGPQAATGLFFYDVDVHRVVYHVHAGFKHPAPSARSKPAPQRQLKPPFQGKTRHVCAGAIAELWRTLFKK